jgi:hypothetical protein
MFFGKREKAQKKILPLPLSLEPSASVFSASVPFCGTKV